jgi:tetratricopeptide (TPR) repeat protein
MGDAVEAALEINPRHVPSLLLLADNRIDAEDYEGAAKVLNEIVAVNPWQPDAWAYRSVLAHLRNDPAAETAARESALRLEDESAGVPPHRPEAFARSTRFSEGRRGSGRRCRMIRSTCRRRRNWPTTFCGWARRPRAGGSPSRCMTGMATTWRPTTS